MSALDAPRSLPPSRKRTSVVAFACVIAAALLPVSFAAWAQGTGTEYRAITRTKPADNGQRPTLGAGNLYALVVGVSKYQNSEINPLSVADKDAQDFAEFLGTQKEVFKKLYVKLLVNEQATKLAIEKWLYDELPKAGKDDTVILFFSGHGYTDPKWPGKFYFVGHDADPKSVHATCVNMSGLEFLAKADAKRVLFIADACHAGGFSQVATKSLEKPLQELLKRVSESGGKVMLTSCKPTQQSQERSNLKNGVFTYFLLRGLKGEADANRDGVITLDEAYDYVYEHTREETQGAQHPQREGAVVGQFPMSILRALEEPTRLDVWFVAQDPRCRNPNCIDPRPGLPECRDLRCGDVTITDGSTMYAGQNYQIGVRPHSRSYVYVYQIDDKGEAYKLFPGRDYLAEHNPMENPLQGGQIFWIPASDAWLHHTDQPGKEKIYVVASRTRNATLENLYAYLDEVRQQGGESGESKSISGALQHELERTMGPSGILRQKTAPQSGSRPKDRAGLFESFSAAIESSGLDAIKSVWFSVVNR